MNMLLGCNATATARLTRPTKKITDSTKLSADYWGLTRRSLSLVTHHSHDFAVVVVIAVALATVADDCHAVKVLLCSTTGEVDMQDGLGLVAEDVLPHYDSRGGRRTREGVTDHVGCTLCVG